jgi:hypothetical protein
MKTLTILIFAFLFQITGVETFKSHETIMSEKRSWGWSDWCISLPADDSHITIHVFKKRIVFDNAAQDIYTLDKIIDRKVVTTGGEMGATFVCNATDIKGKKWVVTICRTSDRIRAIQIEDNTKMIVYQ